MYCSQSLWRKKFAFIHTVSTIGPFAFEPNWLDAFGMVSFVFVFSGTLALKSRQRDKKSFEFLCHPPKFPLICERRRNFHVFPSFLCGDKVFNLIVETYATQTFPELSFLRVHRNSPAQIIKRIKSKQKTFLPGMNFQIKLIWRLSESLFCDVSWKWKFMSEFLG